MLFFCLSDYFRIFYACFQHQNFVISISMWDWDISILYGQKLTKMGHFFGTFQYFSYVIYNHTFDCFVRNWFHIKEKQFNRGPRFHSRWVKTYFSAPKMQKFSPNSTKLAITRYYTTFSYFFCSLYQVSMYAKRLGCGEIQANSYFRPNRHPKLPHQIGQKWAPLDKIAKGQG